MKYGMIYRYLKQYVGMMNEYNQVEHKTYINIKTHTLQNFDNKSCDQNYRTKLVKMLKHHNIMKSNVQNDT